MDPNSDRPRFQVLEALPEESYLEPSLDPCALTPLEPKPDPRLTWGTTGVLVAGAATALLMIKVAPLAQAAESRRTVAVSLVSEVPPQDPEVVLTGGRAGGGDDAIDPRMVSQVDSTLRPQVTVPELPQSMPESASTLVFGVKDLPQLPGGSGLQRGTGEGIGGVGRGSGSSSSLGRVGMQPPGPDYQMVVAYSFKPRYQLPPNGTLMRAVVTVAIVVDDEGRVTSAKAIQGPELLWANAEESALKWRFEPLAKHGLRAPQRVNIDFHYKRIDIKD